MPKDDENTRGAVDRMAQRIVKHSRQNEGSAAGREISHDQARRMVIDGPARRADEKKPNRR